MKLIFKVVDEKDRSIVSLIKETSKISCKIFFDVEKGVVSVDDVNEPEVDKIIETINSYYHINSVEIDNTMLQESATSETKLAEEGETKDCKQQEDDEQSSKSKEHHVGYMSVGENLMYEVAGDEINKLEKLTDQSLLKDVVKKFIDDIGLDPSDDYLLNAFIVSYGIKNITYEAIVSELIKLYPDKSEYQIKSALRGRFYKWYKHRKPEENASRASFLSLLKVFVKKIS